LLPVAVIDRNDYFVSVTQCMMHLTLVLLASEILYVEQAVCSACWTINFPKSRDCVYIFAHVGLFAD